MGMSGGLSITGGSDGVTTFDAFELVQRNFKSSTGRYTLKLKDKLTLITKFITEFGVNFSAALNYGVGGCSISNVESKILFFKCIKLTSIN